MMYLEFFFGFEVLTEACNLLYN